MAEVKEEEQQKKGGITEDEQEIYSRAKELGIL